MPDEKKIKFFFDTRLGQKTEVTAEQYTMSYKASTEYRKRVEAAEKLKGQAREAALAEAEVLTNFNNNGLIGIIEEVKAE